MKVHTNAQLKELVEGCKKRDPECQKLLFRALYGRMLGVCMRYSNCKEDAQDVAQEGFIKLFEKIDSYKNEGSFEGWARRLFVNLSLDALRKNKMQLISVDADHVHFELEGDSNEKVDRELLDIVSPERLLNEIQKLSPVYRTVLNLHVYEGYTHEEIGLELGISAGTSKSNLSKAKANLKKALTKMLNAKHAS